MDKGRITFDKARELVVEELSEVAGGVCDCGCAQQGTTKDGMGRTVRAFVMDCVGVIRWL